MLAVATDRGQVSIQLVSPASGEDIKNLSSPATKKVCFHSISFPSEWGVIRLLIDHCKVLSGFHSISFPSEWGVAALQQKRNDLAEAVSIQLVSPASGE